MNALLDQDGYPTETDLVIIATWPPGWSGNEIACWKQASRGGNYVFEVGPMVEEQAP